jgi:hypothetical protein
MKMVEMPRSGSKPRALHLGSCGSVPVALLVVAALSGWPSHPRAEGAQDGVFYEWTDNEGRAHFSDQPPTEHVGTVERRALPTTKTPPPVLDDDYYSVENQARRLEAARRERAAARREAAALRQQQRLREAQLEAARAQRDAARAQRDAVERSKHYHGVPYFWPAYPPRPRRPKPIRRPHHHAQDLERRAPRLSLPPHALERR